MEQQKQDHVIMVISPQKLSEILSSSKLLNNINLLADKLLANKLTEKKKQNHKIENLLENFFGHKRKINGSQLNGYPIVIQSK